MAEKFLEAVNKGIRIIYEKEKEEHEKVIGKYYPSSIGECLRKQYYEFFEEKEPTEEELTIFLTGKGVHEMLAKVLNESVKVEAVEYEVSLNFNEAMLHGKADIIIADFEGQKVIVELKTISKIPNEPLQRHIMQLQCYLHALNIERGFLLYWDKRAGRKKVFEISKDKKYYEILKERTLTLHYHISKKLPPIKEAAIKGEYSTCIRCPYKEICKPLELDIEKDSEIVVCEIDNVLFNVEERKKACLEELKISSYNNLDKKTKEEFFKIFYSEKYLNLDIPIEERIREIDEEYFKNNRKIVIITNRPEAMREVTQEELTNLGIPFEALFMRKSNQKGKKFKALIIKLLEISGYKVVRIVDEEKTVEKIKKEILKLDPN